VIDAIDESSFGRGASDAKMLEEALSKTSLNIETYIARDIRSLKDTIVTIARYRRSYCDPRKAIPYIHISCHGSKDYLILGKAERMLVCASRTTRPSRKWCWPTALPTVPANARFEARKPASDR
jgi:hypothetical protein